MSLVLAQHEFLQDVAELIRYATSKGFLVTGGELYRTAEMQKLYVQAGRSKTMRSQHLQRLAIDLNFFKKQPDGSLKLIQTRDELKELGDFWEKLRASNRWGGSWRGLVEKGKSSFVDCPHFERI